jgi:hypothetical protein
MLQGQDHQQQIADLHAEEERLEAHLKLVERYFARIGNQIDVCNYLSTVYYLLIE